MRYGQIDCFSTTYIRSILLHLFSVQVLIILVQ